VLGTESAVERLYDHRVVDRVAQLLDAREMCLLREEHRGARVALAKLDQARERVVGDRGVVERQAAAQPISSLLGRDRGELVEAAELAERAVGGREQVAHQMLDRSREQHAYAR